MDGMGAALRRAGPGWLLVATPQLRDPNFRRTVVYVLTHGADGTIGIVLNRPSETAVATVLPHWAPHASRPPVMYVGGPVQTSAAMALGVAMPGVDPADPLGGWSRDGSGTSACDGSGTSAGDGAVHGVGDDLGASPGDGSVSDLGPDTAGPRTIQQVAGASVLVNLDADPAAAMADLAGVRIYAGHAGWGAEQLAAEVAEGAWYVLPGLPDDLLLGPMRDLWFEVLRRQPWPLAQQAYHPGNPRLN